MSDSTTQPRELTAIIADLATATKLVADMTPPADNASKADKAAFEKATTEATAAVEALEAEKQAAQAAILQAAYDAKQAEYRVATTAGVKAALRRDMNRIRKAQGLPELIAGSKSSGPRFDPAVLAILGELEGDES